MAFEDGIFDPLWYQLSRSFYWSRTFDGISHYNESSTYSLSWLNYTRHAYLQRYRISRMCLHLPSVCAYEPCFSLSRSCLSGLLFLIARCRFRRSFWKDKRYEEISGDKTNPYPLCTVERLIIKRSCGELLSFSYVCMCAHISLII